MTSYRHIARMLSSYSDIYLLHGLRFFPPDAADSADIPQADTFQLANAIILLMLVGSYT